MLAAQGTRLEAENKSLSWLYLQSFGIPVVVAQWLMGMYDGGGS